MIKKKRTILDILTDDRILARRSDLVLINKKKNPAKSSSNKTDKYLDLARELKTEENKVAEVTNCS